ASSRWERSMADCRRCGATSLVLSGTRPGSAPWPVPAMAPSVLQQAWLTSTSSRGTMLPGRERRRLDGVDNQDGTHIRPPASAGGRYVIRLQGELDQSWSEWLGGLELSWDQHGNTMLRGDVADQSALHGILVQIRDLGVRLLSIEQVG